MMLSGNIYLCSCSEHRTVKHQRFIMSVFLSDVTVCILKLLRHFRKQSILVEFFDSCMAASSCNVSIPF
jgi:hypothetical protein